MNPWCVCSPTEASTQQTLSSVPEHVSQPEPHLQQEAYTPFQANAQPLPEAKSEFVNLIFMHLPGCALVICTQNRHIELHPQHSCVTSEAHVHTEVMVIAIHSASLKQVLLHVICVNLTQ